MLVVHFIPKIIVSEIVILQKYNYLLLLTSYTKDRLISISSTLECECITFIETETTKPIQTMNMRM